MKSDCADLLRQLRPAGPSRLRRRPRMDAWSPAGMARFRGPAARRPACPCRRGNRCRAARDRHPHRRPEFQHVLRVHDGIEVEPSERLRRAAWTACSSARPAHVPAVQEAPGLIGHEAAAVGEADLERRMALQHAAEHQARGGDGGIERIADQIVEVIGDSRSTPATLMGWSRMKASSSAAVAQTGSSSGSSRFLPAMFDPICAPRSPSC